MSCDGIRGCVERRISTVTRPFNLGNVSSQWLARAPREIGFIPTGWDAFQFRRVYGRVVKQLPVFCRVIGGVNGSSTDMLSQIRQTGIMIEFSHEHIYNVHFM